MGQNKLTNKEIFNGKTVLSIDYGTKNIGFCLFGVGRDPFPLPYEQILNKGDLAVLKHIENLHNNEFIEVIIIGLPKHKDGNDSEMTKTIRKFSSLLCKKMSPIPCFFQDEALSSFEAEDRMKNSPKYNYKIDKNHLDALAASIILEEWLDSNDQINC